MDDATGVTGIEKMPTGIEGFDELAGGGLPRERTTLVLGRSGTGKTVFALQTLVNGARLYGEPGIFVAIEEKTRQIVANAATFGWDLPALERDKLFFLDARMSPDEVRSGSFDLVGMLAAIEDKAREMGARRVVFDSIDVLLRLMHDPAAEQDEIYRLHDWIGDSSLSGIITSGTTGPDPLMEQRNGFMQFMADCVVLLDHRVENRVSQRSARIVKYRGSGFSENEVPITIGREGLQVATFGAPESGYPVFYDRVSTGVARLDGMLDGGYLRGSSVLVTGAPGTAKSTLAAAFAEAACRRGERSLYIGYDESAGEIVRNVASVNIRLQPQIDAGLLRMRWVRSDSRSPEEHLLLLKQLIREHRPQCIVVDPLSALSKSGDQLNVLDVVQRLLYWTKAEGITVLCTSLLESSNPEVEASELRVSTVADTWIHVSYVITAGERNRALTIVKSRGTAHSNQVRELVLSKGGVTLADVYTAGGEVLMGTLRWEKEMAERGQRAREAAETERKRRELEAGRAEIEARLAALQRELALRQFELEALAAAESQRGRQRAQDQLARRDRRHADSPDGSAAGSEPDEASGED